MSQRNNKTVLLKIISTLVVEFCLKKYSKRKKFNKSKEINKIIKERILLSFIKFQN